MQNQRTLKPIATLTVEGTRRRERPRKRWRGEVEEDLNTMGIKNRHKIARDHREWWNIWTFNWQPRSATNYSAWETGGGEWLRKVNCILIVESTYERCPISTVPKVIKITWWVITMSSETDGFHVRAMKNILRLCDIQYMRIYIYMFNILLLFSMFRSLLWPSSGWPTIMHNYMYNYCILVVGHHDDGHRGYRNIFVNNNKIYDNI